jgi:hypothetical protein
MVIASTDPKFPTRASADDDTSDLDDDDEDISQLVVLVLDD